jgi:hypothetical protein
MVEHILAFPRCALFAFLGAGKSVATLTAIDAMLIAGTAARVLVIAPLRVARDVWTTEAAKWDHLKHLKIVPIVGTKQERLKALATPADIHTTNFDQLPWLIEHLGDRWPFDVVVADELTRLKGFRTKQGNVRAGALGKIAHTKIRRFIGLTGTPAPNSLECLWGQLYFLDRGARLGRTYSAFINRWFRAKPGSDPRYRVLEAMPHAQDEIQAEIRDLCLTLDAKDHFDLREPIVNRMYVDLPPVAAKHYRDMEKQLFTELEGHAIEAFGAAAKTQKLLQFCNGAAYLNGGNTEWAEVHTEKIEALRSIVEEAVGAPVLCAYNFRSDLARLKKAFPEGADLATAEGMKKFKSGKCAIGFGHPAGMGHGVDGLQYVCNTIAFFGLNWNLEEHLQVIGRVGPTRQLQAGFDRPVFVHFILARGTVDEMVLERIATKRAVQDILLEALKRQHDYAEQTQAAA